VPSGRGFDLPTASAVDTLEVGPSFSALRDHADRTVSGGQVAGAVVLLLVAVLLGWLNLIGTLIGLMAIVTLGYAVLMAFKTLVTADAVRHGPVRVAPWELDRLDEESLPTYTILVPLYREANVVRHLLTSLRRLDYPRRKLQIVLLCEADDTPTLEALYAANPGPPFEIVRVPPSYPRTKPKVCNIGLERARGEYLVIYDAEDRPAPDQLKKAVVALRRLPRQSSACRPGWSTGTRIRTS
jgi:cellulose synthase/poly-beta-1,6-N-acetylglucosamine synthase-like glycosyltransferase